MVLWTAFGYEETMMNVVCVMVVVVAVWLLLLLVVWGKRVTHTHYPIMAVAGGGGDC